MNVDQSVEIIAELERAFSTLNQELFSGTIQMPEFVLSPKRKLIFKFMPLTFQICVGGDLFMVDAVALLTHLLHEMVHMYNFKRGVVDCRANQYHNKEFVTVASKVGLVCVRHRSQGWVTTLETSNSNAIMPQVSAIQHRSKVFNDVNLDKGILRRAKIYFGQLSKRNRQAIYFLKYECQCPPPHNSIRSGRRPDGEHPLNIMCLDCKGMFNCVDLEDR